jgi:hypothetical protein
LATSGETVVREGGIGADEHVILEIDPIPKLHTTLDGHTVADDDVALDEHAIADVAVLPYPCAREDVSKSPDPRPRPDPIALAQGMIVYEDLRHRHLSLRAARSRY